MTWLADCSIQCREIGKVKMEIERRRPPVFHQGLILKGVEEEGYWKSEDLPGRGSAGDKDLGSLPAARNMPRVIRPGRPDAYIIVIPGPVEHAGH